MKKLIAMISIFGMMAIVLGLNACNTMKGMGQDVQRGGEKIEGAAERSGASSGASGSGTRSSGGDYK